MAAGGWLFGAAFAGSAALAFTAFAGAFAAAFGFAAFFTLFAFAGFVFLVAIASPLARESPSRCDRCSLSPWVRVRCFFATVLHVAPAAGDPRRLHAG